MSSLKEKFSKACQEYDNVKDEEVKLKLYGYKKQAIEGNCTAPIPPMTNLVLKNKWSSWTSCKGMTETEAMTEYLSVYVEHIKPKIHSPGKDVSNDLAPSIVDSKSPPSSPSKMGGVANTGVIKEGFLLKKRDLMKGWRPRYFILQQSFLNYTIDKGDPIPRGSLDLMNSNISIITSQVEKGSEIFSFSITDPNAKDTYKLAADTRLEAEDWLDKLKMAITNAQLIAELAKQDNNNSQINLNAISNNEASSSIENAETTLANIPPEILSKLDTAVAKLLSAVEPDSPGWEFLFDKNGVTAHKLPGDVICVRGTSLIPFNLCEIFALISDDTRRCDINPQTLLGKTLKPFNKNSAITYLQFKKVMAVASRDFCNISHWRYLVDGRLVALSLSDKHDDLCPVQDGIVRGNLVFGGYVMKPTPLGTQLTYVVQSDLKGSIPQYVLNFVASNQPMIVANIRKLLEDDRKKSGKPLVPYLEKLTFDDLMKVKLSFPAKIESMPGATAIGTPLDGGDTKTEELIIKPRPRKSATKITNISLLILMLPFHLFYIPDQSIVKMLGFILGFFVAYQYLVRLHLGEPLRRSSRTASTYTNGKMIIRFPVDLGKLLRYLDSKRGESGLEITLTHIAMKAAATVIGETPSINGYVVMGNFYRSKTYGASISVSVDISERDSAMVKIDDADVKPVNNLAEELQGHSKMLREKGVPRWENATPINEKLKKLLPPTVSFLLETILLYLGNHLGLSIPFFGIKPFPFGVCSIITSPNREGDIDVDISMIPNACPTPITITIGGIRIIPSIEPNGKIVASPALNIAVAIDSTACSLIEGRKFCARLQGYMNEPQKMMEDASSDKIKDNKSSKK